jgi:2'-5' RNA ligase
VLWVGLSDQLERLTTLKTTIDTYLQQPSISFSPEKRPYTPHITLARAKSTEARRVAAKLIAHAPQPTITWPVEALHLMRSTLTPQGAEYSVMQPYPLIG